MIVKLSAVSPLSWDAPIIPFLEGISLFILNSFFLTLPSIFNTATYFNRLFPKRWIMPYSFKILSKRDSSL